MRYKASDDKPAFVDDLDVQIKLFGQEVIRYGACTHVGCEVVNRPMSAMLDLKDVFQHIIHGLNQRPFAQQYRVMYSHKQVLHVYLGFGHQVYAVDEELLEQVLADEPSVIEQFAKQFPGETPKKCKKRLKNRKFYYCSYHRSECFC